MTSLALIISATALSVSGLVHDPASAAGAPVAATGEHHQQAENDVKAAIALHSSAAATRRSTTAVAVRRTAPVAPRYGIDVSWPQCGTTLPRIDLDFAVIGLTHGHARTVSPCLSEQAAWARSQHLRVALYVVPSSPDASTVARASRLGSCGAAGSTCRAYHSGVVQAKHALAAARAEHLDTSSWWLDVEESRHGTLWSDNTTANVAVLKGWVATLRKAHGRVGVYSTGGYWSMITDDWQTRLPQWVAVGTAGIDAARNACARPFTDGPVVMTQWLTGPYDGNLLCTSRRGVSALATAAFDGKWHRSRTVGVPALLTIPVPHPDIEAEEAAARAAEKHAAKVKAAKAKVKAAQVKAAQVRAAKAKASHAHHPKPRPKPQPKPHPKPKPKPKPTPKPSPTPTPAAATPNAPVAPTP